MTVTQSTQKPTNRDALLTEGRRLVKEQDATGWRLAEIVHDLHEDGMAYEAIADQLGWKNHASARNHDVAFSYRDRDHDQRPSFADAYALSMLSEDRAVATTAIADVQGIAVHTARATRQAESKAIAAAISDLPSEQKVQVAKELAQDDTIRHAAVSESDRVYTERKGRIGSQKSEPSELRQTIDTVSIRMGLYQTERAVERVLQGQDLSNLNEETVEAFHRYADRAQGLADFLRNLATANIPEDMDAALADLLGSVE